MAKIICKKKINQKTYRQRTGSYLLKHSCSPSLLQARMNGWFLKTFHFKGLLHRRAIFFRASNLKMPTMMWNNPCQCFMLMFLDWQYCLNAAKLISQYCIMRMLVLQLVSKNPPDERSHSLYGVLNSEAGDAVGVGESCQQSGALLFLRWDRRCAFEQGSSFPSADPQHTAPADDVQKSFVRADSAS